MRATLAYNGLNFVYITALSNLIYKRFLPSGQIIQGNSKDLILWLVLFTWNRCLFIAQLIFTYSKSTIEILEEGVKYVSDVVMVFLMLTLKHFILFSSLILIILQNSLLNPLVPNSNVLIRFPPCGFRMPFSESSKCQFVIIFCEILQWCHRMWTQKTKIIY